MAVQDAPIVAQLRAAGAVLPGTAPDAAWPVAAEASDELAATLQRYASDFRRLAAELVPLYERMTREGFKVAFGDGEGAALYALVRAVRPERVFEVSPASGWSTNYILAALTDNEHGELHSFELDERIAGLPTEEAIRRNLVPGLDQSRLTVHVGDARETTPDIEGPIDFLLLDSCHEPFFAEWYTRELLPRVEGPVVVHDVHFWDRPEASGEAYYLLDWAARTGGRLLSVGALERVADLTGGAPPRWPNPSNAVFAWVEGGRLPRDGTPSPVGPAEDGRLEDALAQEPQTAVSLLRICQLATAAPDVRRRAAERLAPLAGAVPVIEAARALSAAGLEHEAVGAARAAVAARPESLPVRVGAADVLAVAGLTDESASLVAELGPASGFPLAYRYLWRAADLIRSRDESRAADLEREAFRGRPRDSAGEEKFFADYVGRVRRRPRPADVARVVGTAGGRRALAQALAGRR